MFLENPFQSNRLDALTSCADKGVIFSSGKELIRNVSSSTTGSSSGNKTTKAETSQTTADLQSTTSDDDLQSLGYYINNPISISNNKDLEFMFKLSDEEVSSTFNNIIYENKRTVSSLSEYEVVSVESGDEKKGIIDTYIKRERDWKKDKVLHQREVKKLEKTLKKYRNE